MIVQLILSLILICSALGVLLARSPVYASLSFLVSLFCLAVYYLMLFAQFIAVMQILIYAGAILVIFMFVIVLFQDAHYQLKQYKPKSPALLIFTAIAAFMATFGVFAENFLYLNQSAAMLPKGFGSVEAIGRELYVNFFFPFEALVVLFLVAMVGSLYIAKRGN